MDESGEGINTYMTQTNTNAKVFIIILNWNSADFTIACINSLAKLTYPSYEIVLVDNGSVDGSNEVVKATFPEVTFIRTVENRGFSGANNLGINYALEHNAEYIWLLNNDTIVDPNALTDLVDITLSDTKIGMVGSKIFFYDEPELLWYAGANFDVEQGGITSCIGWGQRDTGQFDHITDVGYVSGCSLLVKKCVIDKIGLMPEEYYIYFEETDWNYQAQKAGFRTVVAQKSIVWHKVKRKKEYLTRFVYYMTRNRFLIVHKFCPKALPACIKYQYREGVNLIRLQFANKDYKKMQHFIIVLLKAWLHGLVLKKKGQNENIF